MYHLLTVNLQAGKTPVSRYIENTNDYARVVLLRENLLLKGNERVVTVTGYKNDNGAIIIVDRTAAKLVNGRVEVRQMSRPIEEEYDEALER